MKQPGRLTRFQQSLPAQAAIVTSNLNRYYLSGFLGTAGTLLVTKDKVFYLADAHAVIADFSGDPPQEYSL